MVSVSRIKPCKNFSATSEQTSGLSFLWSCPILFLLSLPTPNPHSASCQVAANRWLNIFLLCLVPFFSTFISPCYMQPWTYFILEQSFISWGSSRFYIPGRVLLQKTNCPEFVSVLTNPGFLWQKTHWDFVSTDCLWPEIKKICVI